MSGFATALERQKWLRSCEGRARSNAKKKGFAYDIDGFAETLWRRQRGRCAVTDVEFDLRRFDKALVKYPYGPSIDRIHSDDGYTKENVRLVCIAVNFGLGQWGDEVFLDLARAAVRFDQKKTKVVTDTLKAWRAEQESRIKAAVEVLEKLPPEEQPHQRHRIAGLRAALKKGPRYMSEIAFKAAQSRRRSATTQLFV
jgi:hypothetical protein